MLCVSLLLFTPALVFTEDAIVASIDAGVAGVAGGTGVPFIGVTLCAEVFSLVVSVVVGVVFVLFTSCALAWLPFFFLLTGFMRHMNDILHALQAFCLSSH